MEKDLHKDISLGACCHTNLLARLIPARLLKREPASIPSPREVWRRAGSQAPAEEGRLAVGLCQERAQICIWREDGGTEVFHTLPTKTQFLPFVPEPGAIYNFLLASWWLQSPLDIVLLRTFYYKRLSFIQNREGKTLEY